MSLNRKEIVEGNTGPAFLPFKDELHARVEVLHVKEMSNRTFGKHVQTFIRCVSSDVGPLQVGVEYSIPSSIYSNNQKQADASAKDLRGQLAALMGRETTDFSFDADKVLQECCANREPLGVQIDVHQTIKPDGSTRRYYEPVK